MSNNINKLFQYFTLAGLLMAPLFAAAQRVDNFGSVVFTGGVGNPTCFLSMSDGAANGDNASFTLTLGTVANSKVPTPTLLTNTSTENDFGPKQTVIIKLVSGRGLNTPCNLGSDSTKWDVSLGDTFNNTCTTFESSDTAIRSILRTFDNCNPTTSRVGVRIRTSHGPSVTEGTNNTNLSSSVAANGVAYLSRQSAPALSATDQIALTAQFTFFNGAGANGYTGTAVRSYAWTMPLIIAYR